MDFKDSKMHKENNSLKKICFVCKEQINQNEFEYNMQVNLPVCNKCKGTNEETKAIEEAFDSLADGLVCGCI